MFYFCVFFISLLHQYHYYVVVVVVVAFVAAVGVDFIVVVFEVVHCSLTF